MYRLQLTLYTILYNVHYRVYNYKVADSYKVMPQFKTWSTFMDFFDVSDMYILEQQRACLRNFRLKGPIGNMLNEWVAVHSLVSL